MLKINENKTYLGGESIIKIYLGGRLVKYNFDFETIKYFEAINIEPDSGVYREGITNAKLWVIIDNFVKKQKQKGLFNNPIYPMLGTTSQQQGINLADVDSFELEWVGDWQFSEEGAKGNGLNTYAKTGFIPSLDQNIYTGAFIVNGLNNVDNNYNAVQLGTSDVNGNSLMISCSNVSENISVRLHRELISLDNIDQDGLFYIHRSSVSNTRVYKGSNALFNGPSYGSLPETEVYLGAINENGIPNKFSNQLIQGFGFTKDAISFAEMTSYIIDLQNLYSDIKNI